MSARSDTSGRTDLEGDHKASLSRTAAAMLPSAPFDEKLAATTIRAPQDCKPCYHSKPCNKT